MGHRKWMLFGAGAESMEGAMREHNALYDAWVVERDRADDLLKDRNTIQGKLDEARKRIAELESPTRVPFSDAQIDAMAREASYSINGWGYRCWDENSGMTRDAWRDSVRRALAAGGLEPCAVPEYDPDDVAHSTPIIADLHKQLEAAWKVQVDVLTAERDRLAAENAELKQRLTRSIIAAELAVANATLDRLRDVGIDPSYHGNPADWAGEDQLDTLTQFQAILYPPETTNDDR